MRLIVTRPQPQADDWVARLTARHIDAIALPLIAIEAAPDLDAVDAAWLAMPGYTLAMFVSPSAVERFFARRPAGRDWPTATLAAGTGPGTARALVAAGVPLARVVAPPEDALRFDAEALWAVLRPRREWQGCSALIVRGEGGRDWLADQLRAVGAKVAYVAAYRRAAPTLHPAQQHVLDAALADPGGHVWLFSSSESVGRLAELAPAADWSAASALATHPRIAEAARGLGFAWVGVVSPVPEAVAATLVERTRSIQSRTT